MHVNYVLVVNLPTRVQVLNSARVLAFFNLIQNLTDIILSVVFGMWHPILKKQNGAKGVLSLPLNFNRRTTILTLEVLSAKLHEFLPQLKLTRVIAMRGDCDASVN